MKCFVAKIVFQIFIGGSSEKADFDIQLRLIQAEDLPGVYLMAINCANMEEESLINNSGKNLQWKFVGITDLK